MPKIERNKDLGSIYFFNVSTVQSGWQNDILYITFIIPGIWKEPKNAFSGLCLPLCANLLPAKI